MIENSKIYGAKAAVYIKYNGEIEDLAKELSQKLFLPEFIIDSDMDPPHETFAMSKALGFQVWLNKSEDFENFPFIFEIETKHCLDEGVAGQMHDLSLWLARYMTEIKSIETLVSDKTST